MSDETGVSVVDEISTPPALVVSGLTRRRGDVVVLDKLALTIEPGIAYGLAGPNGAGKTTLLRILATLERPDAGTISIFGRDPFVDVQGVRRLIGYAGPPVSTPHLTVGEDLDLVARMAGLPRAERADTVSAMLQLVDLYDRRGRQVSELSRGDRKRLAITRALIHDPMLLLLDGPFEGLDVTSRGELRAILAELVELGKTLLITAGTMAELDGICHEAGLLDRGRLLISGPADAVLVGGETGRPLRLTIDGTRELAESLLSRHSSVHSLFSLDEHRLWFRFDGDASAQAALVHQLVTAGIAIVELANGNDEAEVDLQRMVRSET